MSRYSGMLDDFGVLAYAQKNPNTVQFIQNRFQDTFQNMGHMLTDYGRTVMEHSKKAFDYVVSSDAMRFTQGVLRKVGAMFGRNEFRDLWSIHDVQQAPQVMHRWLMTNTDYRPLYLDQRACGFDGTYVNTDGDDVGRDQRDWRLINHGLLRDDEEHGWVQSYFCDASEELPEVDRVVADMKFTIQSAGHYFKAALEQENGADPGSPEGELL